MKRRWLLIVISANLLVLLALVFVYPHLMVSPGPLVAAHADLATDCFACHTPLRSATADRCMVCHKPADIGLRTTRGQPLIAGHAVKVKTAFHQQLVEQDCMACHSDHQRPLLTKRIRKPFSHELLRDAVRGKCETCHTAPADNLHRNMAGNCTQCHAQDRWKPATFAHDKLFLLDRDHNVECATCHLKSDYSRYTCYGCHEHQPDKIRREHVKEGITDFTNCVKCHRNARDEPQRGGGRERRERD